MQIKNASFLRGAVGPKQYPEDGLPEIALVGRSNVGKSSLINRLINRKNLARTSAQPGKTQQLNYYAIETDLAPFYLVDCPGYGYARVSRSEKEKWQDFIEAYLSNRGPLALTFQVIDLRHEPSKDDVAMFRWLTDQGLPVAVIATKADKVPKGKWQAHIDRLMRTLDTPKKPLVFSAVSGYGLDQLSALLEELITPFDED
ncbi:ribosome biogenesis GTP-binding protein YihA/YsxC [Peptococcus niger]|uniref:Probable GTP-binding protein EngB n=1 Tax=Peptococcus niger TaxID=2741 RepID=A0A1G6S2Z4_PEPNI|nr:ribosome biogenesis GTP-binding protein YihA/YsxC [Peptococcus niger]SDD11053.1 GTP-binding protein [Peptococcus niger]